MTTENGQSSAPSASRCSACDGCKYKHFESDDDYGNEPVVVRITTKVPTSIRKPASTAAPVDRLVSVRWIMSRLTELRAKYKLEGGKYEPKPGSNNAAAMSC